jgi:hypothetical protein
MLRVTKIDTGRILLRIDERDLPDETEGGMEFILDEATGRFNPSGTVKLSTRAQLVLKAEGGTCEDIVNYLRDRNEWATTDDIQSACSITANVLRKHLRTLIREGKVVDRGEGCRGNPKEYNLPQE